MINLQSQSNKTEKQFQIVVEKDSCGKRLDQFLAALPEIISRSFAQHLIEKELVKVNGEKQSKHYKVKKKEVISVIIPPPEPLKIQPESIPLKIIYEDSDVIVLSKPAGIVVHPTKSHFKGTLVNALIAHTKDLSGIGEVLRPGIVHRLDKDTSGLMIVAKNDFSHINLASQLKSRKIKRTYLALVHGRVKEEEGTIIAPIGRHEVLRKKMAVSTKAAREAITHFRVKERFRVLIDGKEEDYTLLEVDLETGRTHQIRVHLSFFGHPVVGDPEYGFKKTKRELGLRRQFLHACRLKFIHPRLSKVIEFEDELPDDLRGVLS